MRHWLRFVGVLTALALAACSPAANKPAANATASGTLSIDNWSDNLDPAVLAHMAPFDPGAKYAVPYMQGTIGIGYNADAVAKRLPGVKIDSWAVVFDPKTMAKLKDCGVYFLDASEDMFAVALNYLGKDPNSHDPRDYAAATQMLMKLRPYVRKFHSSEYIDALANGDICLAVGYSGDV